MRNEILIAEQCSRDDPHGEMCPRILTGLVTVCVHVHACACVCVCVCLCVCAVVE